MKKVSRHSILLVVIIAFYANHLSALYGNSNDTLFFKAIETQLRTVYKTCTGDSTTPPLKKILLWKKSIDSITQRSEYSQVIKQFYKDSGVTAIPHLPCEIVEWYHNKKLALKKSDSISNVKLRNKNQQTSDSLFVIKELSTVQHSSCDFMKIPFGISKHAVSTLLKGAGILSLVEDSSFFHYTNPADSIYNTLAFYFDKDGKYFKYEIESKMTSLDSLDTYIRPIAGILALSYEQKIGQPAQQINYIGRFDIKQGKLSISKIWILQNIEVYTGLATFDNRYYAKAIVIRKSLKTNKRKIIP